MCGVAGIVALSPAAAPPDRAELSRMTEAIAHRGPDDSGVYVDGRGGLAHTRLSIIDASGGAQPMVDAAARVAVSYNGEVFDYVELRAELVQKGHVFKTGSDTEVVLRAYLEWGDDCFARFNGQWAIAIWDARREALVLARDRLGVRPLYTAEHAGRLYFASEVKAIFAADPSIPRAFDPVGIDQTLTFWAPVAPRSVFLGVGEVEPGHVRVYEGGTVRDRAYWTPRFQEDGGGFKGSLDDAVDAVRAALERATSLRMLRADVPVGAYLSGGLDSSLVAALARRATPAKFATFSLRFEDDEFDEGVYQKLVADRLGTEHHELTVKASDIARVFPDVVLHAERPILRTAPAPLFLLSGLVQEAGIKVVLTGEGADEVFAGYDIFREAKVRRFWARRPDSAFRPLLLERLYPYLARSPVSSRAMSRQFFGHALEASGVPGFGHDPRWRTTSAIKRLLSRDMRARIGDHDARAALLADLPEALPGWTPLAQDQWIEMRTLLAGYILSAQGDRMLMAHSIEGRFPFLDRDVVALANDLPPEYKLKVLDEKHVLKRAGADIVPAEVLARKKQPYRAPDALSFLGDDAPAWVEEALSERAVAEAGVFEPAAVKQVLAKVRVAAKSGKLSNTDNMAFVGIVSTQLLHDAFIRRAPEAPSSYSTETRRGPTPPHVAAARTMHG